MSKNLSLHTDRNDGIDLLRGISILLVLLFHIHKPFVQSILPKKLFNIIFVSGYYGVIIFFVISGFLITITSLKRWGSLQNIRYRQFYQMRFARIMPCLFALLGALSILDILNIPEFTIHTTSLMPAVFSALTFQINWLEAKTGYLPGNWDVLWSLSVEEMFYLIFPFICIIFRKPTHFILIFSLFVILGPFARISLAHNESWGDHSYLSCMDGIAIGSLAALFTYYFKLTIKTTFLTFLIGLSFFIFIFIFRKQTFDLGITPIGLNVTLLELSIGLILIAAYEWYTKDNHSGSAWLEPLRWFGRNSYEIYLTHMFFVIFIIKIFFNENQSRFLTIFLYTMIIVISGIAGQLISSYFSEPMNKFIRRKIFSKRTTNEMTIATNMTI
jgi:peptidoglycan/LPS O-acetylase OafA/YrhL